MWHLPLRALAVLIRQHQELRASPGDPAPDAQQACQEPRDCESLAPTPENLDAFARAANAGGAEADYAPPRSIAEAVRHGIQLVAVGELVELPWPNDVSIEPLLATAPLGARGVVLGSPVLDARGQSMPLEDAGLVSRDSVADNLCGFPPYGLAFADADGFVADAFGGRELRLLIDSDEAVPFDVLVDAMRRSATE